MEGLERILGEHRLFAGLGQEFIDLAAGCAKNTRFNADDYLFHAEDPADWIYLVRHGRVALELAAPGRGRDAVRNGRRGRDRRLDLAAAAISLGL